MREAETFLLERLRAGPRSALEIEALARSAGIGRRSLTRARGALGVVARKQGFGAGWVLSLPENSAALIEERHRSHEGEIQERQASMQVKLWRCNQCRDTCRICRGEKPGPAKCWLCYR